MKTLNEFIKEITASKELQEEIKTFKNSDELNAFFKAHDCDATAEDYGALINLVEKGEGELPDDLAEAVAGGFPWEILSECIPTVVDVVAGWLKK